MDHHRAAPRDARSGIWLGKTGSDHRNRSRLLDRSENVLITRVTPDAAAQVMEALPQGEAFFDVGHNQVWGTACYRQGKIAVVCAGTSDIPWRKSTSDSGGDGERGGCDHDIGVAGILADSLPAAS